MALGFLSTYAISYSLSLGIIEVLVNDDKFEFRWAKRFLFSKEKDYHVPFVEILHYQHEHVPQYQWIKLILTNNRQFVLSRLVIPTSYRKLDQYDQFVRDLPRIMKESSESNQVKITEGPTIYDSKSIRWLLYVASAITLFLIFDLITNPDQSNSWPKLAWITVNILYLLLNFRRVKN